MYKSILYIVQNKKKIIHYTNCFLVYDEYRTNFQENKNKQNKNKKINMYRHNGQISVGQIYGNTSHESCKNLIKLDKNLINLKLQRGLYLLDVLSTEYMVLITSSRANFHWIGFSSTENIILYMYLCWLNLTNIKIQEGHG